MSFKKIIVKICKSIYYRQRLILLAKDLVDVPEFNQTGIRSASVRDDPKAMDDLIAYSPEKIGIFRQRFAAGAECYVAYNDKNELMAFGWYATRTFFEPLYNININLEKGQFYSFDVRIIEKFRGQFMLATILSYLLWKHFLEKGYNKTIGLVDLKNMNSLYLHSFLDFHEVGEIIVTHFIFKKPFTYRKSYSHSYLERIR